MNAEDIQRGRSIIAAASPGPWTFVTPEAPAGATDIYGPPPLDEDNESLAEWVSECEGGGFNASFICAAREGWSAALDEVERLTACLAKANDNHENFERLWYVATDDIERLKRLLGEAALHIEADTDPDEKHPLADRIRKEAGL